jgi:hypothetical protein
MTNAGRPEDAREERRRARQNSLKAHHNGPQRRLSRTSELRDPIIESP